MELIDRKALLERMNEFAAFAVTIKLYMSKDDIAENVLKQAKETALRLVEEAPTIEAAPVVHGEWEHTRDYRTNTTKVRCSVCHKEDVLDDYIIADLNVRITLNNFCPNCGADMRKEKEVLPAKLNENGCPFDCPCLDDYPDCYCNAKMDEKAV